MIRDKCGQLIERLNTLLPNGNPSSFETGKTMIQGIYNKREKVVYLTDLIMWNDELFIDNMAEMRLIVLVNRIRENPVISNTLSPSNEIMFRVPNIMDCSKTGLEHMYFGIYRQIQETTFAGNYEILLNCVIVQNLYHLIKISPDALRNQENMLKICTSFGYDNIGAPYVKDGLAFIHKEGIFFLGYNACAVQWKDQFVSPYYESLLQDPMVAYLYYDRERRLQTQDGYIVDKTDPAIDALKPDQTCLFTYTNISLNDPFATLDGLKYRQSCSKIVWSSMSHLIYKLLARKNMLPYTILAQQIQTQELAINNA